jgi:pyridine nucleotide-disulfide oxidoreductase family protein
MRKRLLLIGGGHAHLFVLEALRRRHAEWRDRLEVTLLSRDLQTPYSGMLPGLLAGHYRPRECHVDLQPLAASAGVTLVQASVDHIDFGAQRALAEAQEWPFDLVSLDIGSAPDLSAVPGAAQHACGIKPIPLFLQQWRQFQPALEQLARPLHMVVVGGGAGGVEAVLAMAYRLGADRSRVKWSLVTGSELLPGYPRRAARLMARHLAAAGVALRREARVAAVEPGKLLFADGASAAFDSVLWATGAAPPAWLADCAMARGEDGFVAVNRCLQSISHPQLFAAGDIASVVHEPRPKAGVFAVRQGPILAENLLRQALTPDQPLLRYRPQRDYLSLLSTGPRQAVASWYGLAWQGEWVWRWKDRIDQRFMRRFSAPFEPGTAGQA